MRRPRIPLLAAAFAALLLTHLPFLDLPPYWDELGQFVPASLDLFREGAWVPYSTVPNVHPPGVMAWVALWWRVGGESMRTARVAMLLLASAGVLATFLLARRLAPAAPDRTALIAASLLLVSPLFWAQAMMVQLDMPATVLSTFALVLFLDGRFVASAAVCSAAVLAKETAVALPLALAAVLTWERRWKPAVWFALPVVALAGWLAALQTSTGHLFGNSEFTEYNLWYPLHPVRLGGALLRRGYYLFVANFHWIGTLALAWGWRAGLFRTREWRIGGFVLATLIVSVSVLGGATLERYVLPALPILYAAVAAAWTHLRTRALVPAVMLAGMAACIFVNPPYPFPFENNLAWTDFVHLQQQAASYIEREHAGRVTATAWPLTAALRNPDLGYVTRGQQVLELEDFRRTPALAALRNQRWDLVVLYTRTWNPGSGLLRVGSVERLLSAYWGYEREVTGAELAARCLRRWERRGQHLEVWGREAVTQLTESR